jgi:chromosome segregation ATPase
MTASSNDPHAHLDPADAADQIRRLGQEVTRLRGLLESEREAVARDMAAGAAELALRDERVERMQGRVDGLKVKLQRLRQSADERSRRIEELEAELARYRGSRAVRVAARLSGRLRTTKGGT